MLCLAAVLGEGVLLVHRSAVDHAAEMNQLQLFINGDRNPRSCFDVVMIVNFPRCSKLFTPASILTIDARSSANFNQEYSNDNPDALYSLK